MIDRRRPLKGDSRWMRNHGWAGRRRPWRVLQHEKEIGVAAKPFSVNHACCQLRHAPKCADGVASVWSGNRRHYWQPLPGLHSPSWTTVHTRTAVGSRTSPTLPASHRGACASGSSRRSSGDGRMPPAASLDLPGRALTAQGPPSRPNPGERPPMPPARPGFSCARDSP